MDISIDARTSAYQLIVGRPLSEADNIKEVA